MMLPGEDKRLSHGRTGKFSSDVSSVVIGLTTRKTAGRVGLFLGADFFDYFRHNLSP